MWRLDKTRARFSRDLTFAEQQTFDTFQNAIQHHGMHPREAAKMAGDTNYKCLAGDQYQIRLSQGNRATFRVHTTGKTVEILQVGGHT